jgi:catechol 2,3-dioxygenase-like lactoylglutathione lyase family enzyme
MTSTPIPLSTPAVHSVDEFVISVPDLQEARHFYRSFGLDVQEEEGGLGLYTVGHPHRRVLPGPVKRLLWVSFGIHATDQAYFAEHLPAKAARVGPPPGAPAKGIWIQGPDGLPIQLTVADKCSPSHPAPRQPWRGCANPGRSPARSKVPVVQPLYLSHILMFSADVDEAVRFYTELLGLKLSDKSGSVIAFMHTPHGSDHHLIALAKSGGGGLHHSSWCVGSLDAVGIGMEQMARAGYGQGWGVGRHVLGSNYFRYVRDPWGSYAEYSYDIDFVEAGAQWPAADHPGEDALYVWGPELPPDFVTNHELVG